MSGREPWSEAMSLRERVEAAAELVDQPPAMRGTLNPRQFTPDAIGHVVDGTPRVLYGYDRPVVVAAGRAVVLHGGPGRRGGPTRGRLEPLRQVGAYWIAPEHAWDERLPEVRDWRSRIRGS